MSNGHFNDEVYAFHALGLCDAVECAELHQHLERKCDVCLGALTEAFRFWYLFGSSTQQHQAAAAAPSRQLRDRVLAIAGTKESPAKVGFWGWKALGAALAAGVVLAVGTWQASQSLNHRALQQSRSALSAAQSEVNRLRDLLAQRSEPATAPSTPSPVEEPAPQPSTPDAAALRQMESLRDEVSQTRTQLADAQTRVTGLERQLAGQNTQLQAAVTAQNLAEQRARDAVEQATKQAEASSAQRTDVNTLRARVRDLEDRLTNYRAVVEQLQRRADQQVRLASLLENPALSVVRLRGTESGRSASGVALIAGNSVLFFASNLPTLDRNRSYQLWLIRDRGPAIVSAGTFTSWGRNAPVVQFNGNATSNLTGLAVTEEPAGGSPLPTGHKLLVGTPRG